MQIDWQQANWVLNCCVQNKNIYNWVSLQGRNLSILFKRLEHSFPRFSILVFSLLSLICALQLLSDLKSEAVPIEWSIRIDIIWSLSLLSPTPSVALCSLHLLQSPSIMHYVAMIGCITICLPYSSFVLTKSFFDSLSSCRITLPYCSINYFYVICLFFLIKWSNLY